MNNLLNFKKNVTINNVAQKIKKQISSYIKDEEGAGVIELVLILVVLIGLVLVFKDKIGVLLNNIFTNINSSADAIYNN